MGQARKREGIDYKRWWDYHRERIPADQWAYVQKIVERMMGCRNPQSGFARYVCPKCYEERIVPFSCKTRFCPSCGKVRTDQWVRQMAQELCDVPHYHLTLTIAKEMRIFFDRDRSLLKLLATEAAASVREVIAAIYGDIRVGMVYTIHTFGRDLLFKPHVHLVLTAGGLNKDGHWIDFDGILGSKLVVTWKKRLCDHLSGCHPQNHPIHTVLRRVRASLQSAGASLPPPLLQNGA